jgi:hypothetical protein
MRATRTLLAATILTIACLPTFAAGGDWRPYLPDRKHDHEIRGAPGPIAGVGLPVLAIGYGVYLLIRRYRRKS